MCAVVLAPEIGVIAVLFDVTVTLPLNFLYHFDVVLANFLYQGKMINTQTQTRFEIPPCWSRTGET